MNNLFLFFKGGSYNRFATCLLLIILLSGKIFANINLSSISGKVVDGKTHMPLENVIVLITDQNIVSKTDSLGYFQFSSVKEGRFTLKISLIGYKSTEENVFAGKDDLTNLLIHLFPEALYSQTVIITGEHPTSAFDNLEKASHVLKDRDLQRDIGLTLAATLKNETGLAMRSMGPAPARPVIRGLGGDRVVISEDGFITKDLSSTSPDHAVSVDPFTAERIEVIRGPKILCKTSSTLGGIVNVIKDEIPFKIPSRIKGSAGVFGESVNNGFMGAVVTEVPVYDFVIRGELSNKRAGNLSTPIGLLNNSDLETLSYAGGLSFVKEWGFLGVSYRTFESDYGVPGGFIGAHPNGIDISMMKHQLNTRLNINLKSEFINSLDVDFSRNYYRHKEFENNNLIGAEFALYDYSGNIKVNHSNFGFFEEGSIGLTLNYRDFKVGGYVFTPLSNSFNTAAYFFESFHLGKIDFQFAARYNLDQVKPEFEKSDSKIGHIRNRFFNTYSLSLSAVYELWQDIHIGTNLSKSSRVPTIEELFSEGPHLAAYSYETGNPDLEAESGIGNELFLFIKNNWFYSLINVYYNSFSNYIIPRNTGKINYSTLLPVYASSGERAFITGIEAESEFKFSDELKFNFSLSYTYGELKSVKSPLPAIPPLKGLLDLQYSSNNFSVGISSEFAASQNRIDKFEQPTSGYLIFNSFSQYIFITGEFVNSITFNAENLFNKEYRNHLSRVKSIIPEAGRNFKLTYKLYF